jgi:hypothetical protein
MKILFNVFLTLLLCVTAHAATPTISNVSGTVNTGQTLTVTGSNMVDENKTGWDDTVMEGFETTIGLPMAYSGENTGSCQITFDTSANKILGTQSIKFRQHGAWSGAGVGACYVVKYGEDGLMGDRYVSSYIRYDASAGGNEWPDNFMKAFLTVEDPSDDQLYLQPHMNNGAAPDSWYANTNSTNYDFDWPYGSMVNNRWYHIEFYYKNSSPKNLKVWVDGQLMIDVTPTGDSPGLYPELGIINLSSTSSGFDMSMWADRWVTSSNRIYPSSKIEIANSATYATATKRYQEPVYLSDGSVQIKADLTGLGAGPYYLFVTNNRQEVSSAYNLSGEQPPDTEPPTRSAGSPTGALAAGTTSTTMSLTTNESATCKYGTTSAAYASLPNTFAGSGTTSHSATISGLTNGGSYTYYVRCQDDESTPNVNTDDYTISWTVSMPSAGITPGTVLFSESFEDNSWSSRSWYDGTTATGSTAGGYSGNGLRWVFDSGDTNPDEFVAIRKKFTAQDEILVEYWVKFDTGWVGSQQPYHPHSVMIMSEDDGDYQSLAASYNNLYTEYITDVGGTTIRPSMAGQDLYRVNTSNGTPPNNLSATTETRSAYHCNTPYTLTNATGGTCYAAGGGYYYSANTWTAPTVTIPINTWTRVRYYFKRNTFTSNVANFDGIMRMWVGDTLAIEDTAMMFAANAYADTQWDKVVLAPWIGDNSPANQTMWIDELKIYDGYTESSPITGMAIGAGTMAIGAGTISISTQ